MSEFRLRWGSGTLGERFRIDPGRAELNEAGERSHENDPGLDVFVFEESGDDGGDENHPDQATDAEAARAGRVHLSDPASTNEDGEEELQGVHVLQLKGSGREVGTRGHDRSDYQIDTRFDGGDETSGDEEREEGRGVEETESRAAISLSEEDPGGESQEAEEPDGMEVGIGFHVPETGVRQTAMHIFGDGENGEGESGGEEETPEEGLEEAGGETEAYESGGVVAFGK